MNAERRIRKNNKYRKAEKHILKKSANENGTMMKAY